MRVLFGVVHAVQHHIFKRDTFGVRQAGIIAQRVQQGRDVPLFVDRNQAVADVVGGGVERHGKQATDFGGGAGNFRHDAAGGQGDTATAQRDAFVVHHYPHRVADIVEIIQGLAHAHQHDIADQAVAIGLIALDRPFAQIVASQHDLADNLGGGQVAHKFLGAGVTERTGQRAADLR